MLLHVHALATPAPPPLFRIPAGDAAETLGIFAAQSSSPIVYLVDVVRGERTRAIAGTFDPADALRLMLTGTGLAVREDRSGAMTVVRRPERISRTPPAAATAAPTPTRASELVRLPEFTVSSTTVDRYRAADAVSAVRVRANLLETPSSISVLTREALDDLSPTRLFDATRYLAGIEDGRGIQFSDRQILRGFESNGRTVDNFFQNSADNVDDAIVERVEVSKGPNAILAPAGVPGGSINVITKSPAFTPVRSVTLLAGLFDAQKLTVDATGPIGAESRFAYRVIAAAQDSRRYWSPDSRMRGKVFAPMLTWRVSDRTLLTVKLIAAEHWIFREPGLILDPAVTEQTAVPYLAPGFSYRSRNGVQPWSHVGTHSADGFLLLTSTLSDRLALRIAGNGRYLFEDSTQEFFSTPTFNNRYNPYTGELTPDQTWALDPATGRYAATTAPFFDPNAIPVRADTQKTVVTTTNLQADGVYRRQFGAFSSQTVVGLALSHYDSVGRVRSGTLPAIDLSHPDVLASPLWASALYGDLRIRQTTQAAYVNQRVGWFDDRIQLTGGLLRYAVFARSHDHVLNPDRPSVLEDYRWLGLASVLVRPAQDVALYFTRSTNSTPTIANNLALWRDGRQDEFGVKAQFFHERLAVTAARFRIRQTNVTIPNPDHQTDPTAPEQMIADLGDHGFELEATGGLTPAVSIIGAYTWLRLRDSLGRRIRAVADENAALLVNYRFGPGSSRPLAVFAGVVVAGKRAGDATAENFTPLGVPTRHSFMLPQTTTLNAGAMFRHGRWGLRLNIDNLLNRHDRLQQVGGRVSGTGLTTMPGLNVRATTTLTW